MVSTHIYWSFLFIAAIMFLDYSSATESERGANSKKRFLPPGIPEITTPAQTGTQVRIVRGGRNLIYIKGGAVPLTDPVTTATTPTTTTKSPEQLLREKEIEKKKQDPKGFSKKLLEILKVEKEAKEMSKEMHSMLDSCTTNEDCGNSTCCYKEDPNLPGECRVRPHEINRPCTDLCDCVGHNLKCERLTPDGDIPEGGAKVPQIGKCKNEYEFIKDILKKFKKGKGISFQKEKPRRRTQRIGTHRIVFV